MDKGYKWAVDIDLEEYFDTVNHDKLIGLVYKEVKDIRVSVFSNYKMHSIAASFYRYILLDIEPPGA